MSTVAIVLASGRGSRLGGPKALLAWPPTVNEAPLAAAHVAAREECDRVFVVTRAAVAAALRRHAPRSFSGRGELVVSTAAESLGPAGSLAAAADRLGSSEALAVVTPVDCPPVRLQVVAALLDALGAQPAAVAARPLCGTRRGHPVVLRAALLERYYLNQPPRPLRDVLRELGDAVVDVASDDPAVLLDINTTADLARWARHRQRGECDEGEIVAPVFFE